MAMLPLLHVVSVIMLSGVWTSMAQEHTAQFDEARTPVPTDYCEGDIFEATCGEDEVVIMYSARYGRMQVGKCLSQQMGDMGCNTNILPLMDTWCSGRHHCEVRVSSIIDAIPDERQPCARDFRSYLEASYYCVKTISKSADSCISHRPMEIREQSGFLASIVTDETTCGSIDAPWVLNVKKGQTIDIELLDFFVSTPMKDDFLNEVPGVCHVYAIIKEEEGRTSETICGSHVRRSVVFTSTSNVLEIRLVTKRKSTENGYFLLKYVAKGCPDPPQPNHGWVQRTGNQAVFGCNATTDQWRLTCDSDVWQGQRHNCTKGDVMEQAVNGMFGSGSQWASIIIILAIAVTLGLVIFLTGLIILRRRCIANGNRPYRERQIPPQLYSSQYRDATSPYGAKPLSAMDCSNSENDYYRTWQLQRHPPGARQYPSAGAHGTYSDQLLEHAHTGVICANPNCGHIPYDTMGSEGRQHVEHIYESPKFERKDIAPPPPPPNNPPRTASTTTGGTSQQYFELDPEEL